MSTLFLLFNHTLTQPQEADARSSLNVERIVSMPHDLSELWSSIPPELAAIKDYIRPIKDWLASKANGGDYVLIQGDFGACYLMVNFSFNLGLIPIYSTTRRETVEKPLQDGSIELTRQFQHQVFRRYEV